MKFLDNILDNFFHHPPRKALGIDIGGRNIKAVLLKKQKKKGKTFFTLENYAIASIQGSNQDIRQMPVEEVSSALKQILEKADINTNEDHVVMSLPALSSFLIIIQIPLIPQEELAKAIKIQAKKYIPIPLKEVTLGWSIIEQNQSEKTMRILLVAVNQKISQRLCQIGKTAGLNLKSIEVETFSLARSLNQPGTEIFAIIDMGAKTTNLGIIKAGLVIFNRTIDLKGSEIGKNPDLIMDRVKKIIQLFEAKHKQKIVKIILTGGVANLANIDQQFYKFINIPTIRGNPWQNIFYNNKQLYPFLRKLDTSFSIALGLALRDLI